MLKAIGTGSFKATEFVTGQRIKYEASDSSWRGKSKVQTVTIQGIPEPATLLSALRTGQVDIIFAPPADQVASLQRDGFNLLTHPVNACTQLSLNPAFPTMHNKPRPRGNESGRQPGRAAQDRPGRTGPSQRRPDTSSPVCSAIRMDSSRFRTIPTGQRRSSARRELATPRCSPIRRR